MKSLKLIKTVVLILVIIRSSILTLAQQTFVNQDWNIQTSVLGQHQQIKTTIDSNGNLIYISNVDNSNDEDIVFGCLHSSGNISWQQSCFSSPIFDDYGVDVKVDDHGNIFTCSAKSNGLNQDFYVSKHDEFGNLIWSSLYNGPSNKDDIPASIALDTNGDVYLTGSSRINVLDIDFVTIKYNGNNGNQLWVQQYNYSNKPDLAIQVLVNSTSNEVFVCGTSAQSTTKSDFVVIKYSASTGAQLALDRHQSSGIGHDLPSEMIFDNNGGIFLIGTTKNNQIDKDIKILAYDSNLNIVWSKYIDKCGNSDEGLSVAKSINGDILISGYCTKPNGQSIGYISKINAIDGSNIWVHEKTGKEGIGNAKSKKIVCDYNGRIYVASEADVNGSKDIVTSSFSEDGQLIWEKYFNNSSDGDDYPSQIVVSNNDIFVTGVSNTLEPTIVTIKYTEITKPQEIVYANGEISHIKNELLIRFDGKHLDTNIVDKTEFEAGLLSDFVSPTVISKMNNKTGIDFNRLSTFKIFRRMSTSDSLSITRLGDTIRVQDWWALLSVFIPEDVNDTTIIDSLNTMFPDIKYVERNYLGQLASSPNDNLYTIEQTGLYNQTHGIHVESAWNNQVGQPTVKIGVFDTGVNYRHEDFGDGTFAGSKIAFGWDYSNNVSASSQAEPDLNGHGTAVAGIIGAIRNNNIGVAGITGGDFELGNTGCQLYGHSIVSYDNNNNIFIPLTNSVPAIVEGAIDVPGSISNYGGGLHIQNHSWGQTANSNTLRNAVNTCYINNCYLVAASGNTGTFTPLSIIYPSSYTDKVLKVGGNNAAGTRHATSTYGNGLHVLAPGTFDIYATLDHDNNSGYSFNENGTSFASPHAAGACGLLYSEHNVNNGYPNNLAPEDMEHLIKLYATDVPPLFYDIESGHGRINISYSLSMATLPIYRIEHKEGPAAYWNQIISPNINISLSEDIDPLPSGSYIADRYQLNTTFFDYLNPNDELINSWKRHSSSIGYSAANPVSDNTWYNFSVNTSGSAVTVNTTTYCWFVKYDINQNPINQWIPAPPDQLNLAYSLHIKNNDYVGVSDLNSSSDIDIYPNPNNGEFIIDLNDYFKENVTIELFDALGRRAYKYFCADSTGKVIVNGLNLSSGVYVCVVTQDNKRLSKKLIVR